MKAIILAAGRGSRMRQLTDKQPKCLVSLRGQPLIEWQLAAIRGAGVKEIAVVTGYKRELISKYKLVEFHNIRWFETNMVASLVCAKNWLQSEPCLISYSDIFYETSAVNALINSSAKLALTYDPNWQKIWEERFEDPLSDAETFVINSSRHITEIGNKPKCVEEVGGQYMGLLRITPESWKHITSVLSKYPKNVCDNLSMTELLGNLIQSKEFPIIGIPYQGEWGEIDSQSDLAKFDAGGYFSK